jgi:hypothetical protein
VLKLTEDAEFSPCLLPSHPDEVGKEEAINLGVHKVFITI